MFLFFSHRHFAKILKGEKQIYIFTFNTFAFSDNLISVQQFYLRAMLDKPLNITAYTGIKQD